MAEMQAQFFFLLTQARMPLPASRGTYRRRSGRKDAHTVEYAAYVTQLARDMGTEPGALEVVLLHGWIVAFTYL